MKKLTSCQSCILAALAKIHLVDKFLIVFMIILLLQSSYTLFIFEPTTAEINSIDTIIRTSIAAIFGYFLSTNFIRHASTKTDKPISVKGKEIISENSPRGIKNQIGFAIPESEEADDLLVGSTDILDLPEEDTPEYTIASRLQVIVAAGIGLFCLLVLIIIRNLIGAGASIAPSSSSAFTVAQFRDIVSGCIGFLIGCPTSLPPSK